MNSMLVTVRRCVRGRGAGGEADGEAALERQPSFRDYFMARTVDGDAYRAMPDLAGGEQAPGSAMWTWDARGADARQVAGVAAVVAADDEHQVEPARSSSSAIDRVLPVLGRAADRVEGAEGAASAASP